MIQGIKVQNGVPSEVVRTRRFLKIEDVEVEV